MKVCHLSSVHRADDVRIFVKECRTLAQAGYETHVIAPADVGGDVDGVKVHPVAQAKAGRIVRMLLRTQQVYAIAKAVDADIYHLHDPELLPFGLLLQQSGKMVIYDAHENLPDDVMEKQWLPVRTRSAISRSASVVEREFTKRLSAVVAATPHICDRFSKFHKRAITVKNYPLLQELQFSSSYVPFAERRSVTYIGTITADRGIEEMVLGVADTTLTLEIAGAFSYQAEREAIIALPQWDAVKELGRISRSGVVETLRRSLAGLVVLHPTPAFVTSLPIKMFEYMAAGIPVVASDFPSWREIIEKHRCGICVPARQPAAIAGALRWLVANPSAAQDMGERGLEAVKLYYNWEAESARLIQLYEELVFERRRLHKAAEAPNLTTES